MARGKHIDVICIAAVILALALCALLYWGDRFGIRSLERAMGYETRLFSTDTVHTIDIVMEDWEGFLATAQSETYTVCSVVIDGETFAGVGIRGKGNTSLSTVASMDSDRYSFKLEFDQYDNSLSYYGLDKLSLNNLIQDTTYMKDYLVYRMMAEFGAAAPLCSYVNLTVNGEPWGLYLAVEGVEDAFLQRNYGTGHGELYKPDSMELGGGRGNGKDFRMDSFMEQREVDGEQSPQSPVREQRKDTPFGGEMPTMGGAMPAMGGAMPAMGGAMPAMGGEGASLQYIDDDFDSYTTIFDSAKTNVTDKDKERLIAALKSLGEGTVESCVDVDAMLRYLVVHNFAVNGDSYTGSMVHNYYLYEEAGRLTMVPWDYNLAFGTFQSLDATDAVNDPLDAPLSIRGDGSRPMVDWVFQNEDYTALYHRYFASFLAEVDAQALIDEAAALIAPYVAADATAFYRYEEHLAGVETLRQFCALRAESVSQQLRGEEATVDASALDLTAMGTMNMGNGQRPLGNGEQPFGNGEQPFGNGEQPFGNDQPPFGGEAFAPPSLDSDVAVVLPEEGVPPDGFSPPENGTPLVN